MVKANVLESCAMSDEGKIPVDGIEDVEANITFDGMSLSNYTTIVSYIIPARISRNVKGIGPP